METLMASTVHVAEQPMLVSLPGTKTDSRIETLDIRM